MSTGLLYVAKKVFFNCQDAEAAQQDEVDEAAEEAQKFEIALASVLIILLGRHDCGCHDRKKGQCTTMVYFVALSNCARYYAACLSQGRAVLRGSRVRSIICPMGGERSSLLCFYIGTYYNCSNAFISRNAVLQRCTGITVRYFCTWASNGFFRRCRGGGRVRGDAVNKGGCSGPVMYGCLFVYSLRGHCQSSKFVRLKIWIQKAVQRLVS